MQTTGSKIVISPRMLQVWEILPFTVINSHLVAHNAESATASRRTYEIVVAAFACYELVQLRRRHYLSIELQLLLAKGRFQVGNLQTI